MEDGMDIRTDDGARAKKCRSRLSPEELSKRTGKTPHPLKAPQAEGLGSSAARVLSCRFV